MATVNQCFVCNWLFEFRLCTIVRTLLIYRFQFVSSLYSLPSMLFFDTFFPFILPLNAFDQFFPNTMDAMVIINNFQNENISSFIFHGSKVTLKLP